MAFRRAAMRKMQKPEWMVLPRGCAGHRMRSQRVDSQLFGTDFGHKYDGRTAGNAANFQGAVHLAASIDSGGPQHNYVRPNPLEEPGKSILVRNLRNAETTAAKLGAELCAQRVASLDQQYRRTPHSVPFRISSW